MSSLSISNTSLFNNNDILLALNMLSTIKKIVKNILIGYDYVGNDMPVIKTYMLIV